MILPDAISVPYKNRTDVWKWCVENKICIEYAGTNDSRDWWRVPCEKERMWFALRWS